MAAWMRRARLCACSSCPVPAPATARELGLRGARVLLVARSEGPLRELADEIGMGAAAYPTDVSDAREPYGATSAISRSELTRMR